MRFERLMGKFVGIPQTLTPIFPQRAQGQFLILILHSPRREVRQYS